MKPAPFVFTAAYPLCAVAAPAPPPARVHAIDVHPGDRLADGRMVVARARAIDGTIDFALHNGDRANFHPFRRVSVG